MRLGRIILALLAPLISVAPSLVKTAAPSESKQPGVDALMNLWRAPLAAAQADSASHDAAQDGAGSLFLAASPSFLDGQVRLALPAVAADAALRLISRQSLHFLLRC